MSKEETKAINFSDNFLFDLFFGYRKTYLKKKQNKQKYHVYSMITGHNEAINLNPIKKFIMSPQKILFVVISVFTVAVKIKFSKMWVFIYLNKSAKTV